MNKSALRIKKMDPRAVLPKRAHPEDAGLDLHVLESVRIPAGQGVKLRTGIALEIPAGCVGMVADRSSLAAKGLKTAGGIIDAGYRGEVHIVLRNLTSEEIGLEAGDRVAQLLLVPILLSPVEEATELSSTSRAAGGFGSTGR
jgi:dUTP pyrophosphatase